MINKIKRAFTMVELLIVTAIIIIFLVSAGMVVGLGVIIYKGATAVEKDGVKGVTEQIYYGKDNVPQEKYID